MAILIRVANTLKLASTFVASITEYSTETLVLLIPAIQSEAVQFTWVSPAGTRFEERTMYRDVDYDEVGYYAYSATVYPVMTVGLAGQQTSANSLFSFRIGTLFSPLVRITVLKSVFPEQSALPTTNAEEMSVRINTNIDDIAQNVIDIAANEAAIAQHEIDIAAISVLTDNNYTDADKALVDTIVDKVDKVAGKELSTNDFTDLDKIEVDKVTSKQDKLYTALVSKTTLATTDLLSINDSEASNVLKKITLDGLRAWFQTQIVEFGFVKVITLPTENILTNKIYLLEDLTPDTDNLFEEWIYVDNVWELIGGLTISLSDYYTKTETYSKTEINNLLDDKVDKVIGSSLVTDLEITKLGTVASGAQVNVIEEVKVNGIALTPVTKSVDVTVPTDLSELTDNTSLLFSESYNDLTDKPTIPAEYTLPQTTSLTLGGVKVADKTTEDVEVKLDPLTGKLYVPTYPVDTGEVNVQSDWNAVAGDALILNKPSIPTDLSDLTDNSSLLFSRSYNDLTDTPTIPTVPVISTDITADATDDTKTASPKAVKTYVDTVISSTYKPSGSLTAAQVLPALLVVGNLGNVYNVSEEFTTTVNFVEGTGTNYPAGTNIVVIDSGASVYKFDVLAGFVDLSGYALHGDILVDGIIVDGVTLTPASKKVTIPKVDTISQDGVMTWEESAKLAGIAAGAEVNVQSDWNATEGDTLILNKPTIPEAYTLPQAIETVLGGIKAKTKTTETVEAAIDTSTGKLYVPTYPSASGEANVLEGVIVDGTELTITTKKVTIPAADATAQDGLITWEDKAKLDGMATTASELPYVNTTSGLAATNTQTAIDEVAALVDGVATLLAAI